MQRLNPVEFGREWACTWNSRDLEAALKHFHEDVVFASPVAQRIGFAPDGIVHGKDALRRYWQAALARNPALRFTVKNVFQGADAIAIHFADQDGTERIEFLRFRDNLVVEGHGTFVVSDRMSD